MACNAPLQAWQRAPGDPIVFDPGAAGSDAVELAVPCRRCTGCRLDHSRDWAIRCMHEAQVHDHSCAITLTYRDDALPELSSLAYRDFQLFLKRARKRCGPFRFLACGEYGEEFARPHFHAMLFGLQFPDRRQWSKAADGTWLYRSALLEELWPHGQCLVGDCTMQSAGYIARYALKKVNGSLADAHYSRVDISTGEVVRLEPECLHMSLKPAIGAWWFARFHEDLMLGYCVVDGKKLPIPARYLQWIDEFFPQDAARLALAREEFAQEHLDDQSFARRADKEAVLKARLQFSKRSIKK